MGVGGARFRSGRRLAPVLVAALLAGCTGRPAAFESEVEVVAPPTFVEVWDLAVQDDVAAIRLIREEGTQHGEADAFLASCMADAGFELVPPTDEVMPGADEVDLDSAVEFAYHSPGFRQRFGWGTSTLGVYRSGTRSYRTPEFDDEDERAGYNVALHGEEAEQPGCLAQLRELEQEADNEGADVRARSTELGERLAASPESAQATAAWAECAAADGHDFPELQAVYQHIADRLEVELFDARGLDESYDLGVLNEIRDEERRLAVELYGCEAAYFSALAERSAMIERELRAEGS